MFTDRRDAGRRLAQQLRRFRGPQLVILGVPRGGVPVAAEVAAALDATLDILVVRKLGVPGREDVAMGAVGEHGVRVVNRQVMHLAGVDQDHLIKVERTEREALRHQTVMLRQGRRPLLLVARTAVIVDDGVATGAVAEAACQIARLRGAAKVVLAVPVAAADALRRLCRVADEVVCLSSPTWFGSMADAYEDFSTVSDHAVAAVLERVTRTAAVRAVAASGVT